MISFQENTIFYLSLKTLFPVEMETIRNRRKLAALNNENCEEYLRSNLAQNSYVPRSLEDYITQFSEVIESRVTKKLSQEFSRTENRILGALARLDGFPMNRYFRATAEPLRRRPTTPLLKAREQKRTTTRVILNMDRASSTTRRRKSLAQEKATTWNHSQ